MIVMTQAELDAKIDAAVLEFAEQEAQRIRESAVAATAAMPANAAAFVDALMNTAGGLMIASAKLRPIEREAANADRR